MNKEAHTPAFPQPLIDNQGRIDRSCDYGFGGLTKREYFAAMAMQGMVINLNDQDTCVIIANRAKESGVSPSTMLARISIDYADATLAELEKGQQ